MAKAWLAKRSSRAHRGGLTSLLVAVTSTLLIVLSLSSQVPSIRLNATGTRPNAQLTASGVSNGSDLSYSNSELWGGGSPVEQCPVCEPSGLLASVGGQSLKANQDVDPIEGDFTTTVDLPTVSAIGGTLGMNLTYDSASAAAEEYNAQPGPFGYGWGSVMSASATDTGSGAYIVTSVDGSQNAFQLDTLDSGSGPCPMGDNSNYGAYTVPLSNQNFCAQNRVNAQFGFFSTDDFYQFNEDGGKQTIIYDGYGAQVAQVASSGNGSSTDYIEYIPQAVANTPDCPAAQDSGIAYCFLEIDITSGRIVSAEQDESGQVVSVSLYDGSGGENQGTASMYYNAQGDLDQVSTPASTTAPDGGDSTWGFTYQANVGAPALYTHDLTQITNPDGHTRYINYSPNSNPVDSNGMVSSTTDYADLNTTTYSYTLTDCANPTSTDCLNYNAVSNTDAVQTTTVTYPDGEVDTDTFTDAQLTNCTFGGGSAGLFNQWSINYTEPSLTTPAGQNGSSGQNGPIEEAVELPDTSTATIYTDGVGNIENYTDPMGIATTWLYNDVAGNPGSNLDELCWTVPGVTTDETCGSPPTGATSYTYDAYGDESTKTDPLGNVTSYGYYSNLLLCWMAPPTAPSGGSNTPLCGSGYNSNFSPPAGDVPTGATAYSYDNMGQMTAVTTAWDTTSTATTTYDYSVANQILYSIPPNGQGQGGVGSNPYETTYDYASEITPQPIAVDAPLGHDTEYTYDAMNNVLSESDLAGDTYTNYDADGRACWTIRSFTAPTSTTCTPPTGATSYTYLMDTSAQASVTDPDGNTTSYSYADGRFPTQPTETTEAAVLTNPQTNIISYTSYSPLGQVCMSGPISMTAGDCTPDTAGDTLSTYDSDGRLTNQEDGDLHSTTYAYTDTAFPSQPTSMATAGQTTHYTYDAAGDLVKKQTPGNWISFGYNSDGQQCYVAPLQTSDACSSPPSGLGVSTETYNAALEPYQMIDNAGTSGAVTDTYAYDLNGNLLSTSNDNAMTTSYTYNDDNDVTCMAYPYLSGSTEVASNCTSLPSTSNHIVQYTYNAQGHVGTVEDWNKKKVTYGAYNALSDVGTIQYPGTSPETVTYGYDAAGNLTSDGYSGPLTLVGQTTQSWTPNADEQVGSSVGLDGNTSPSDTYNSYSQDAQATNPTTSSGPDRYTYQPNGEILTDTPPGTGEHALTFKYTANANDELNYIDNPNAGQDASFAYTAAGQRCQSVTATSQVSLSCGTTPPTGTTSYGWNAYGELCWSGVSTSTTATCFSPPSGATTYSYDGSGLRTSETTGSSTLQFDWETVTGGGTPLAIYDGTNSYIYGPTLFGGTAPIEEINSNNAGTYIASTPSGVQTAFKSNATAPVEQAAYSIWGEQTIQSGTDVVPFGFQGSYTDSSGLVYDLGRYYDPNTDQFISVDPMVANTGQPYAFAGDNPLNATDPLGLYSGFCPPDQCPTESGGNTVVNLAGSGNPAATASPSAGTNGYSSTVVSQVQTAAPAPTPSAVSAFSEAAMPSHINGCTDALGCNVIGIPDGQGPTYDPPMPQNQSSDYDYAELCMSLVFVQPCLTIGDAPHISLGVGIGTPGPTLTEGTVHGESGDSYLCGSSVNAGGSYGAGAEFGSVPGKHVWAGGIQFGIGVGVFKSWGTC